MGSIVTLCVLAGISMVLFLVLVSTGKKKASSQSSVPSVFSKQPEPSQDRAEEVIRKWYSDAKEIEFRDNVLKDVAAKIKTTKTPPTAID